jgi:hypothetical protein
MKKNGVPARNGFADHHAIGLVDEVYFDVIVIVNNITRSGNHNGRCHDEKEPEVREDEKPLLKQKKGGEVLSKRNDGKIPKTGKPEKCQNQLHLQKYY